MELTKAKDFTLEKAVSKFGYKKLMETLFEEKIEDVNEMIETNLYKNYMNFINSSEKENENFLKVYKVDSQFALGLDSNIYLYHLCPKEIFSEIVPWSYADSKKFLGDTWWEEDEEILSNIRKLNIVEFLKLYKGY